MIDIRARQQLANQKKDANFMNGVGQSMSNALESTVQRMEDKTTNEKEMITQLGKLGQALVMIYKSIPKLPPLPKIFQVKGEVEVTKPIKIDNLADLARYFTSLEKQIGILGKRDYPTNFVVDNLFEIKDYFDSLESRIGDLSSAISRIPPPRIEMPKIVVPKNETTIDIRAIVSSIKDLEKALGNIPHPESTKEKPRVQEDLLPVMRQIQEGISSLANRPTMVTPPVTNVNINGLNGTYLATSLTVGTNGTALPSSQLANRRSLVLYNNDTAKTVFIGGAGVTASGSNTGLPVLASSYSPALDAGQNMILYGVVASGTAQVIVLEMSHEASGR